MQYSTCIIVIIYLWVSTLCSDMVQPLLHPAWIQVSSRKKAVIAREANQRVSPFCRKELLYRKIKISMIFGLDQLHHAQKGEKREGGREREGVRERERKREGERERLLTSFLELLECISGCGGEVVSGWFGVILQLDRGLVDMPGSWRPHTN